MEIYEQVELYDCPLCEGPSILEEEQGGFYATCLDCGCMTGTIEYKTEEERLPAAKRAAMLWNTGKVISFGRGGE